SWMFCSYQSSKKPPSLQERMKPAHRIVDNPQPPLQRVGELNRIGFSAHRHLKKTDQFFGKGMFKWESCRLFFSLFGSHQVVILTDQGPAHPSRSFSIVGWDKTSKNTFVACFPVSLKTLAQ